MTTTPTDFKAQDALFGRAVPSGQWSADNGSASYARHLLAARKPMISANEVKTVNGFDRRPSGGST